ncbi:MAG: hypothetical protein HDR15_08410 [Lachnospiraceae bacterium]|nr:hypothetical protein [Lachnospiraceae bacterium]
MKFTYESYTDLIKKIQKSGYQFTGYQEWQKAEKTVILRHDVDMCLEKAVRMSELEKELIGGGGVYFVLLTSDFYNVHSKWSKRCIHEIIQNGGTIGLHFDEAQYEASDKEELKTFIIKELDSLSDIIGMKVDAVSMHRPSEKILSAEIDIPGVINSYASCYFKQMKYLSDSRRHWREDVDKIVSAAEYPHLHILTHPFWYMDGEEKSLHHTLKEAVLGASVKYYDHLNDNFRDLGVELPRTEIETIIGK